MTLPWFFSPFFLADVTPNISRMRATEKEEEKLTVDYLWQTPPIQIFYWTFLLCQQRPWSILWKLFFSFRRRILQYDRFWPNHNFDYIHKWYNQGPTELTSGRRKANEKLFTEKEFWADGSSKMQDTKRWKIQKKPFLWWKCPRIVSLSSAGGAIFGGRPRSDSELPKLSLRRFDHNSKVEEAMQNYV